MIHACQAANEVFEEHFVRGAKSLPAVAECDGITGGDPVYRVLGRGGVHGDGVAATTTARSAWAN